MQSLLRQIWGAMPDWMMFKKPAVYCVLLGVILASALCAMDRYVEAAAAAFALLALGVVLETRPSIETILLVWFVTTPLASFYLRFPTDKSIITYDRAVFAIVIALSLAQWFKAQSGVSLRATKFEITWMLFSIAALASVTLKSANVGYATRIPVDSFWLPLVAFHFARHHFDWNKRRGTLL